ncbi:MAG: 3-hydroxyacyl-CoA dehydrogenase, partial [Methylibium sp.]|nr:3-hydroxyacyl-CoA dehydrogenase [Methylibium sp.]
MKHAVITGGGSGIGAAVAQRLRADGLRVTLMGRHLDRLRAQQAVLGDAAVQVCDVADEASVAAAFAAVGEVDVLVNNAGQVETASFSKTSLDLWQRLL